MVRQTKKLEEIKSEINKITNSSPINIIVVTKGRTTEDIIPLLEYGHRDFGENFAGEIADKWFKLLTIYPDINIHYLGRFQTNKIKIIKNYCKYIHTLDSLEHGSFILKHLSNDFNPKIFLQIKTEPNDARGGIELEEAHTIIPKIGKMGLNIIGLMTIAPIKGDPEQHFSLVANLGSEYNFKNFSMGMSNDFHAAVRCGSNYIRIGTKIFE